MWRGFQAKKLNTHRELLELEFAANWAEPENQAELVPGPDLEKIKNFNFFFKKPNPPGLKYLVKSYCDPDQVGDWVWCAGQFSSFTLFMPSTSI